MAQQAYAASNEWPQQQQQQQHLQMHQQQVLSNGIAATTLQAMPAIVGGNQTSQYSPQDTSGASNSSNYYQQQLIKSAQQQFAQHQRMNGTTTVNSTGEGLYNGVASRPAPIYAPKPTYYSQQQQQPLYQQTRAFYTPQQQQQQQQQHSPATSLLQHQPSSLTATGLSVRQLPGVTANTSMQQAQVNGIAMLSQQNSPQSNHLSSLVTDSQQQVQSSSVLEQQQRGQQMPQLITAYQQQQPFNQIQQLPRHPATIMQPQIAGGVQNYAYNVANENIQQQQQEARRSQIEEQHRLIQQQHLRHSARASARLSDRDSVSTLSRFNQFDDRRSFTMRSQYTSANNATKYSRKFGFLELTGEAVKRLLGLANDASDTNKNSSRLLSPVVDDERKNNSSSSAKITSIDSGEDYYFKRKVFKYQLVILRVISFLCAAFVLLSPVAMLLIPKLESVLHSQAEFGAGSNTDAPSSTISLTRGSSGVENAGGGQQQSTPSVTVVTHAVGLTGANRHQNQANSYFIPQPQWRISECTSDCDGPLIGFFARFIMLCIAYWAIFFRSQTSSLPRIDFHRCLLISMAVLLTLAYWLFFIFRVFDKRYNDFELQYMTIVQFALSMLESLILLHYLAVVLLELRERKKIYCLKVVRSPDGASQYLSCGSLSIQKCAQFVLEKYHREFKNFTPYHEHMLELEDELAKNLSSSSRDKEGDKSPLTGRSRANSPANSTHGTARSSRHHHHQSTSRPSRHHSRANSSQHRSPSRSPVRSSRGGRSRSQRKSAATNEAQQPTLDQQQQNSSSKTSSSQVKLYQVDLNPPTANNQEGGTLKTPSATNENSNNNNNNSQDPPDNKDSNAENDSADQSSDATSRMKESSLETIRAANSASELLSSQQQQQQHQPKSASAKQRSSSRVRHGDQEQSSAVQQQRDETESVRSVRSRRSTSRSQHRHREHHHHHHHRERSSSRMNGDHHEQTNPSGHDDRRRSSGNTVSIPMNGGTNDAIEEHERKLRRRKYRLLAAVQDTFEQIRQIDEAQNGQQQQQQVDGSSTSLQQQASPTFSPNQAARSLYPSMARSLQKYLRLTKQTGRHNLQSIYEHLSKCLLYRLSPRAFLEKFLNQDPVWQQSETNLFAGCRLQQNDSMLLGDVNRFDEDLEINSWSLVCDTLLSRQINSGTFFVLKQGQVSLLVTVAKLPHLNLTEEVIDQKSCKFALTPNSETSV